MRNKITIKRNFVLISFVLNIYSTNIFAQNSKPEHIITVAALATSFKPSGYFGYTFQKTNLNFTARIIGFSEDKIAWSDNKFPLEKYYDAALLVGQNMTASKNISLSFNSGLSWVIAVKRGKFIRDEYEFNSKFSYFEEKKVSTIALPLELKLSYLISTYFGFNVIGYANLNNGASTVGIGAGLIFGKLR